MDSGEADPGLSPEAKLLALSDDQMGQLLAKYLARLNLTPAKIRDPSATAYKNALLKKIEMAGDTVPDPELKGYDGSEDDGDDDDDAELGPAVDELTAPTVGGRASLTVSIPSTTEPGTDTLSPLRDVSADALSPSTASGGNLFNQMNLETPPAAFAGAWASRPLTLAPFPFVLPRRVGWGGHCQSSQHFLLRLCTSGPICALSPPCSTPGAILACGCSWPWCWVVLADGAPGWPGRST